MGADGRRRQQRRSGIKFSLGPNWVSPGPGVNVRAGARGREKESGTRATSKAGRRKGASS